MSKPWHEPPSPIHPALSSRQSAALLEEIYSARNLLRDSVRATRGLRMLTLQGDSVLALGSIGVEKAAKLILGCAELHRSHSWPTKSQMITWGHNVDTLHQILLQEIQHGLRESSQTDYAKELASRIFNSNVIPLLFATYSRFGKSGRFHYLDILATDQIGEDSPPSDYWERLEQHIAATEIEFQNAPFGNTVEFDSYLSRLRNRIADELEMWWFCIHRLGIQGCFGPLGKVVGQELWDPSCLKPPDVSS